MAIDKVQTLGILDSAVTSAKIVDDAITTSKIVDGAITSAKLAAGAGGIAWQSVQTSSFTAVASNGYPCNTTSAAFTVTLPSSASVGDTIQIVDYAGTFATYAIRLTSSLNIEGAAYDKLLTTNREGVTITYADATQGWVATSGVNSGDQALDLIPADFLVIAGGGAGGVQTGPGGGAGGFRTSTQGLIPSITYTITVGAGGASFPGGSYSTVRNSGTDSSISGSGITTITSAGGGGGSSGNIAGADGGSGGGGGGGYSTVGGNGNTPSTSPSQGNNGGYASGSYGGGGGGGASAAGSNGSTNVGGNGGNGSASSITGSSITYAGGGGGGPSANGTHGLGGTGGGGDSLSGSSAENGTVNLGGGGGGADGSSGSYASGAGGSGVVILSVPTASYSGTTSGSPTVSTSGANTIMKFTGSGSYTA